MKDTPIQALKNWQKTHPENQSIISRDLTANHHGIFFNSKKKQTRQSHQFHFLFLFYDNLEIIILATGNVPVFQVWSNLRCRFVQFSVRF